MSLFLFGICARRLTIAFQRTLGNVLLSGALVSAMEPHYLSQTVLLSECVCVPLGRLITLADKRTYDNSKDTSMTDLSTWLIAAACEKVDHHWCGVRSVSCAVTKQLGLKNIF